MPRPKSKWINKKTFYKDAVYSGSYENNCGEFKWLPFGRILCLTFTNHHVRFTSHEAAKKEGWKLK
jgi:hypothetical protein